MKGRVEKIENGLAYLELADGQRCWFEPLGDYDIEVDDIVTGNLWSLGGEELFNETKGYSMSVSMEDHT